MKKISSFLVLALILGVLLSSCSIKRMAVNSIGNSLAGSGGSFTSDNDPVLVGEALPFSLKLMESLLDMVPKNKNLLTACCKNFAMYSYAFIQQDAERIEDKDYAASVEGKRRAKNIYLRSRNYGLRGLDLSCKGFSKAAALGGDDLKKTLARTQKKDVELLYWTGMSWIAAVNLGKNDPALMADLGSAELLVFRAFDLDPDFDMGAIHGFLVTYQGSMPEAMGGSEKKAREHFKKVVEMTEGLSASPYLALAEAVAVKNQNKKEFEELLNQALAIDVDKKPEWRLQNLIYQQRAKWLLTREEELFAE